ncbi:MAG TPA: DUF2911 domain-containing protein [Bryobacteraceae bacterium]|jgi:hypothetical protein|nr:DUF2911 domain-containing protein [Bryobacteraceae bacterium]
MRSSIITLSLVLIATAAVCLASSRQKTQNKLSPPQETTIKLNGRTITIEYNAPSARGRKVEGGLIPYGRVWRAGADAATTLSSDADLTIGNLRVPKGEHTLYVLASSSGWQLIVNKQTGQWGTEYNESQDLGRVPMQVTQLSTPQEQFKIDLKPAESNSAMLVMSWGNTQASVPVRLAR